MYPDRVWEPCRDENGNIKQPMVWSSREVTDEDLERRKNKTLQAWQIELGDKLKK
jgi:hypothetical protein